MNFDVPQFIDVEDKIAFQLTAKQLGWFALGGVLLFFAWNFFDGQVFFIIGIVVLMFVGAFAFFKPQGITLAAFLTYGFIYATKPKRLIWKRYIDPRTLDFLNTPVKEEKKEKPAVKVKSPEKIEKMAEILDSTRNV